VSDVDGNTLVSAEQEGSLGGFGPAVRRFITAYIYNGDFSIPPRLPTSDVNDATNKLPYWSFVVVSGSSVQAVSTVDAANASGRTLVFTMAEGAAGDEGYIEQIVPVNGSRSQSYIYLPVPSWRTGAVVNGIQVTLSWQFLKQDGVTTTGSAISGAQTTTAIGANTTYDLLLGTGLIPTDAYYVRIRVGVRRAAAAITDTLTVSLCEVRLIVGGTQLLQPDGSAPGTYGSMLLRQDAGVVRLLAGVGSGVQPFIDLDAVTGEIRLYPFAGSAPQIKLGDSASLFANKAGYMEHYEITAPANGAANSARLFARDNGAGKTQLCVIFSTGAIQCFATEP
jgi:hypothetical protein